MKNEEYVQLRTPNKCMISDVIDVLIDDRPLDTISSATGIKVEVLEDILAGRYDDPLELETIEKLVDVCGSIDRDGYFELLVDYNGMERVVPEGEKIRLGAEVEDETTSILNTIYSDLFLRGFRADDDVDISQLKREIPVLFKRPSIKIARVSKETKSITWEFIMSLRRHTGNFMDSVGSVFSLDSDIRLLLQDAWAPDTMMADKASIVFLNKGVYDRMCEMIKEYKINTDISLLLIDVTEGRVLEACNLGKSNVFDTAVIFEQQLDYKNTGYIENNPYYKKRDQSSLDHLFLD